MGAGVHSSFSLASCSVVVPHAWLNELISLLCKLLLKLVYASLNQTFSYISNPSRPTMYSVNKYSQLTPCRHLAITDTPILRTATKTPAQIYYRCLTELNSCNYGLSLVRMVSAIKGIDCKIYYFTLSPGSPSAPGAPASPVGP